MAIRHAGSSAPAPAPRRRGAFVLLVVALLAGGLTCLHDGGQTKASVALVSPAPMPIPSARADLWTPHPDHIPVGTRESAPNASSVRLDIGKFPVERGACVDADDDGSPGVSPVRSAGFDGLVCDPDALPRASTVHDGADGVINFTGLCFRRSGRTAAAVVLKTRWSVGPIGHEAGGFDGVEGFRRWLSPHPHEREAAASCVIASHVAVIVPLAYPTDNHMHAMHRLGSVVSALKRRFGAFNDSVRDRIVLVFVELNGPAAHPPGYTPRLNAFATFASALAARWVVVREGSPGDVASEAPVACFREAFTVRIQFPAGPSNPRSKWRPGTTHLTPNAASAAAASQDATMDVAFPMFGPRTAAHRHTATTWRRMLLRCFLGSDDSSDGPRARWDPQYRPKLTIVVRTETRRFAGFDQVLPRIVDFWSSRELRGDPDVAVVEHIRSTPHDLAKRFRETDVTIGAFGAGLMWGYLMPPQSVMVEISRGYGCTAAHGLRGWNVSTRCEYTGDSYTFALHHLAVVLPPKYGDESGHRWEYVPWGVFEAVLRAAMCRWRLPASSENVPTRTTCAVPFDRLFQEHGDDPLTADDREAFSRA